ncbi:hypothetical protein ABZ023_19660 [Streptomyces sp. NPDC006367]
MHRPARTVDLSAAGTPGGLPVTTARAVRIDNTARDSVPDPGGAAPGA